MRSPKVVDFRVPFGFVPSRIIVSHPRSRRSSCASFQGEDTYKPGGNVSYEVSVLGRHERTLTT